MLNRWLVVFVLVVCPLQAMQLLEPASQSVMRRVASSFIKPHIMGGERWCSSRAPEAGNKIYADATVDVAFKQMLWQKDNDPIAMSFIRTFVPDIDAKSVEILGSAPLAIPALKTRGRKQTFMDFHVKSKDGHHYIVEMQSQRHIRFDERALFYACSTYSRQLEDKHFNDPAWYVHLKPGIAIQVVDYDTNRAQGMTADDKSGVDPQDQDFIKRVHQFPLPAGQAEKHFMMTDKHSGQKIDHLQLIQIELPRYRVSKFPKASDTSSDKDWWIRVLRFSDAYKEKDVQRAPDFVKMALDRLTLSKWDPVMVQEYKESVVDRGKYSTVLQIERAEGRTEGRAEGEEKATNNFVDAMIGDGMSDAQIFKLAKAAGKDLTPTQLQARRDALKK